MTSRTATHWRDIPAHAGAADQDLPDAELVARTKQGCFDAFSLLAQRHERIVYNLCYRFVRDPVLAEDMTQEAFLKAFRLLDGFRGDSAFTTWLYRVACSVCLSELERRKRRGEVELQPGHLRHAVQPEALHGDVPELVRQCVARLPAHYASAITLHYFQGIPYDEIATILNVPLGTVKTWMHRARAELRDIVARELDITALDQIA